MFWAAVAVYNDEDVQTVSSSELLKFTRKKLILCEVDLKVCYSWRGGGGDSKVGRNCNLAWQQVLRCDGEIVSVFDIRPSLTQHTSKTHLEMHQIWILEFGSSVPHYLLSTLSRPDIYPTLPKYSVRLLRPWNQVHIEYEVMAQPQYRLNKLRSEQKTQWTDIRHDRAILLCSLHHNI